MLDFYEDLPEWLRWILFLPVSFVVMYLFNVLVHVVNPGWNGSFILEKLFLPFFSGLVVMYLIAALIPRWKMGAAYFSMAVSLLFVLISIFAALFMTSVVSGLTWKEVVQSIAQFSGVFFIFQKIKYDAQKETETRSMP